MCREVLENNFAAREVLNLTELPKPPFAQWIPDRLWALQRKLLAPFFVWLTVGLYDPPVRELMGYTWSRRDEWLHRRFGDIVRLVFAVVPARYRKHPRARAGWDRATGRIPADTPLVQTPASQLAAARRARQPKALLPQRLTAAAGPQGRAHSAVRVVVSLLEAGLVHVSVGVLGSVFVGVGVLVLDMFVFVRRVRVRVRRRRHVGVSCECGPSWVCCSVIANCSPLLRNTLS